MLIEKITIRLTTDKITRAIIKSDWALSTILMM